jgi:hypothetical protein
MNKHKIIVVSITGIILVIGYGVYLLSSTPITLITPIMSVIKQFNQSLQPYLETIPIQTRNDIRTSMALTVLNVHLSQVKILVNPNFLTFSKDFQEQLLTHEYLNILGAEKINLDDFNDDLQEWYNNPNYGEPTPESNYFKYTLYFNLYSRNPWQSPLNEKIDQFAFVGDVLNGYPYLSSQITPTLQVYYHGILGE